MYYHINLCRGRHVVQLQCKGDLPLCHGADTPAADHAPHLDGGFLAAQHLGKGRVHGVAHGRKIGQRHLFGRQRRFRLAFSAGQLPGLRLGDPLGLLGHKAVRLGPVHPQGDADGHRAVSPDPQVELFHLAAGALIPDAAGAPQPRCRRFACHGVRRRSRRACPAAAAPAPRR